MGEQYSRQKKKLITLSRYLCMDVAYGFRHAKLHVSATDMIAEGAESLWTSQNMDGQMHSKSLPHDVHPSHLDPPNNNLVHALVG